MGVRKKHAPVKVSTYFAAHSSTIDQLRERGFIIGPDLDIRWQLPLVTISGELACGEGLCMTVDKALLITEDANGLKLIHTYEYAYNFRILGVGNIFRYDNSHPHFGHHSPHHVHRYDPPGEEIKSSPYELTEYGWPTLGQALLEAEQYYWEHYEFIHNVAEIDNK